MSEEQIKTTDKNTTNQTTDPSKGGAFDDDSINKIIADVEKDLESKNTELEFKNKELVEKIYTNLKGKFDTKVKEELEAKNKEIEALKSQVSTNNDKMELNKKATEEAIKKIVEEYKSKFNNIDSVLNQGQTQIKKENNPFKQTAKTDKDKYTDLTTANMSEEEKIKAFYKYVGKI